jgi:predicted nucleic acid-binding protein
MTCGLPGKISARLRSKGFSLPNKLFSRIGIPAEIHTAVATAVILSGKSINQWATVKLENAHNPFIERRLAIQQWQNLAQMDVSETEAVLQKARILQALGLRSKDALHIACAVEAEANYFITTDDLIIKKLRDFSEIQAVDPIDFIAYLEGRK